MLLGTLLFHIWNPSEAVCQHVLNKDSWVKIFKKWIVTIYVLHFMLLYFPKKNKSTSALCNPQDIHVREVLQQVKENQRPSGDQLKGTKPETTKPSTSFVSHTAQGVGLCSPGLGLTTCIWMGWEPTECGFQGPPQTWIRLSRFGV